MKKLTLLGLALVLASSYVMANEQAPEAPKVEENKPGFFSRNWTKAKEAAVSATAKTKDGVTSARDKYVNANVRAAQFAGDKLGLRIAARKAVENGELGADAEGLPFEGPVAGQPSSIQAHPYRTTAVVTSAALAAVYGVYKLGQVTGVNAKIAQATKTLLKKLGFASKAAQVADLQERIETTKEMLKLNPAQNVKRELVDQLAQLEIELQIVQA